MPFELAPPVPTRLPRTRFVDDGGTKAAKRQLGFVGDHRAQAVPAGSVPAGPQGTLTARRLEHLQLSATPPALPPGDVHRAIDTAISSLDEAIAHLPDAHVLDPTCQALTAHHKALLEGIDALSEGPMVGDALLTAMHHLEGHVEVLEKSLQDVEKKAAGEQHPAAQEALKPLLEELGRLTQHTCVQLRNRIAYVGQAVNGSPMAASRLYDGKARISDAAVAVLDKKLQDPKLKDKQKQVLQQARTAFSERGNDLAAESRRVRGQLVDPRKVLGRKWLGGPKNVLLHLPSLISQRLALRTHVGRLMKGEKTTLATPEVDEQKVVETTLAQVFQKAGLPPGDALHELHAEVHDKLNNGQEWKPILKELQLQQGNATVTAYSEITPAAHFFPSYEGKGFNSHSTIEPLHAPNLAQTRLADASGKVLFSGIRHGVLSAYGIVPKEAKHVDDESLHRMGRLMLPPTMQRGSDEDNAKYIRQNPQKLHMIRKAANVERAKEVVAATLLTDPALLQRACSGEVVDLDILSLSLLTPDRVRNGTDNNERQMWADQQEAWHAVANNGNPVVIDLPPSQAGGMPITVRVRVKPVPVNFGVNQGAVGGKILPRINAVSGWDDVQPINDKGFEALFGTAGNPARRDKQRVGAAPPVAPGDTRDGVLGQALAKREKELVELRQSLSQLQLTQGAQEDIARGAGSVPFLPEAVEEAGRRLPGVRQKIAAVEKEIAEKAIEVEQAKALYRQVLEMYRDRSYRFADTEPYKMPTRLAVLADMLGVKVAFNCKSGKDRTGELDVEIKHLKLQMQMRGRVPEPNHRREQEEVNQFFQVATNSGNFEMQRLNTGHAGFKLHGVATLYAQFGGGPHDELTDYYHGTSDMTAS